MRNFIKNLIIILLVFFVISGIVMIYNTPVQKISEINLNELANQINDGKVKDIQVEGENLNITLDGRHERKLPERNRVFSFRIAQKLRR